MSDIKTTKREKGYYWVRYLNRIDWIIALWEDDDWSLCGSDEIFSDRDIGEIGERISRA